MSRTAVKISGGWTFSYRALESSATLDANELLDAAFICESAWRVPSSEATFLIMSHGALAFVAEVENAG